MAGLAKLVNEGKNFSGKTIVLDKNIDLSEHRWTPIGDEYHPFSGTFEGNDHTISYLYINVANYDIYHSSSDYPNSDRYISHIGLFGYIIDATLKDLKISNSSISVITHTGEVFVGGFAGYTAGNITNCQYSGKIDVETMDYYTSHLGGITGYSAKGSDISECSNSANLTNTLNVSERYGDTILITGGIVGHNSGSITNCSNLGTILSNSKSKKNIDNPYSKSYLGGICGNNLKDGTIHLENYTAANKISSKFCGYVYLGGICGDNSGFISISNYINDGSLTAYSDNSDAYLGSICGNNSGTLSTIKCASSSLEINVGVSDSICHAYVGGMVGYNDKPGVITDSYNSGNISATPINSTVGTYSSIGGIVGWNLGTVSNCYNLGNVKTISDENSYGAAIHAGGIIGDNKGNIINCYNSGNLNSISVSVNLLNICTGGIAGYNYSDGKISSCYNTGKIESFNSSIPVSYNYEKLRNTYAGGITGYNYGSISASYNIGAVSSTYTSPDESLVLSISHDIIVCSGGITGYNDTQVSKIESCYNTGEISSTITSSSGLDNTEYTSSILKLSFIAYSGGIIGNNYHGDVKNCYNIGNIIALSLFNSHPLYLLIDMSSYAGGISGYCTGENVSYCYNIGNIESKYTSVDNELLNNFKVYNGGITGDYSQGNCADPFLYTYYASECIENPSDNHGTALQLDQMDDSYLLGGNDQNINLNDQDVPQWSPDLYESNNNLPILSHVPTQVKPLEQESVSKPPKSTIYVTPSDNIQTDNYLETIVVKNGGGCDLKAHVMDVSGYSIASYQWYKLDGNEFKPIKNETGAELNLEKNAAGTYYVKVTYEQNEKVQPAVASSKNFLALGADSEPLTYTYTSLTITVVELPETQKLIEFKSDGVVVSQQILSEGKYLDEPENPIKSGYSFLGWYDESGTKWNFKDPVIKDMTLTANWKYNTPYYPSSYSLNLQSNNSSSLYKEYSGSYGTSITLPQIDTLGWEYKDHTFKNWNTKADGSGTSYSAGDRFSINSNVTLYAQWEEVSTPPAVQKVTVTFYIGNEVYKVIEVNKDSSLKDKFPVNPESSDNNSNFKEWNTKEDASGTAFTADSVVNEDTSVYAVWEKSSSSSSHSWWWIIIIIIILIIIIAAYYYYRKNQN